MKSILIATLGFSVPILAVPPPADGIKSKTTHAAAYGPTNNAVMVDPAKDLPRYPAVEPKEAAATWQVKKGFKLELVAHEPLLRDPIAICFDERGRMFVCEMIDYSEMRDVTPHLGRISVLEDRDGDGFFETSRVFADDLPWPTGLIWANGGLYVGATPDIWRFEDKDGDGRAEVREKIFTGFGTGLKLLNVQGLMNSFQWGQDNRVHVLAGGGNRGVVTCPKRLDLKGIELSGRDFWFDPLTYEFGLEGGGAQYGMSFDNYGRKFGCSNSDHLQYWVYDDRYAARNPFYDMPPARRSIAVDGGAAEVFRISPDEPWRIIRTRWRIAGVVKGAVEGGGRVSGYFTGATGTTIYRGDAYGPEFVNNSFTGDAGGQLIHRKIIRYAENGIDLIGERPADERGFEFAASKDTWVRVVNFANAPDGCLYVCDMYREVIEHPWSVPDEIKKHLDLNSGNDRGRIWRIVPEGGPLSPLSGQSSAQGTVRATYRTRPALDKFGTEELVQTLGHPNGWHRDTAQRLLSEREARSDGILPSASDGKMPSLLGESAVAKLHWLAVLEAAKKLNAEIITTALGDEDAFVRERAVILAGEFTRSEALQKMLLMLTKDPAPRVRMAYAMLLSRLPDSGSQKIALAQSSAANPWIIAAVLNSVGKDAMKLLQDIVSSENHVLEGSFAHALLGMIGQQRDPSATRYAIRLLSSEDAPVVLRRDGLKALAGGLRRAGTYIATVDTEGSLATVFSKAAATAADVKGDEKARLESIELLGLATVEQASAVLQSCLKSDQSEAVQVAAVRASNELGGKGNAAMLVAAWGELKGKAREMALGLLLAREEGMLALLAAMGSPEPPKGGTTGYIEPAKAGTTVRAGDFSASQVQALVKHKDAKIAALAKAVLASVIPPSREEVVRKFQPAIAAQGNAVRGQAQFMARCLACHRANAQGLAVGPDMVTVKTKGREALLTAILEPHKEVASQFIAYTVTTKDGQTLSGFIASDDANSTTLKMAGGAEITVQRANIKGSSSSGQSLMPEGLEQGMTVQDMADLLSFIESVN